MSKTQQFVPAGHTVAAVHRATNPSQEFVVQLAALPATQQALKFPGAPPLPFPHVGHPAPEQLGWSSRRHSTLPAPVAAAIALQRAAAESRSGQLSR